MYKRGKNLREILSPSLFPIPERAGLANSTVLVSVVKDVIFVPTL